MMIGVEQAQNQIRDSGWQRPTAESCPLAACAGRILSENIYADRPYPPFDRVAMDGIAICAPSDKQNEFLIEGVHRAGDPATALHDGHGCLEVMTGSILPSGTDTVLPYESLEIQDGIARYTNLRPWTRGQNIHAAGSDCAAHALLLPKLSRLGPTEVGIAASVGKSELQVLRIPRVALVSTGDELVAPSATPELYQIRSSNVYAVQALLRRFGFVDCELFHLGDSDDGKAEKLAQILRNKDCVILSGGVSAGKFDFVPSTLSDLKVRMIFHRIRQKPGKPLWFGMGAQGQMVFGLPGNPVSSLVCARRYVVPALTQNFATNAVTLAEAPKGLNDLTLFLPVLLTTEARAQVVASNGSGDFSSLRASDGFVQIAAGQTSTLAPYYAWEAL